MGEEVCPACKGALDPVVHFGPKPGRAWTWRVLDWVGTAVLVFLGATALLRYAAGSRGDEAAELAVAARAQVSLMNEEARGALWVASDVCEFGNRMRVERTMARLDWTEVDPAVVLQRCDDIGVLMRRMGLLQQSDQGI